MPNNSLLGEHMNKKSKREITITGNTVLRFVSICNLIIGFVYLLFIVFGTTEFNWILLGFFGSGIFGLIVSYKDDWWKS